MPRKENLQLQQQRQQTEQPAQILQNAETALQQEQALQNERQNQALQEEELQRLQTEQAAPAEETRLQEAQANETLVAEARQELEAAVAAGAAEGTPVQEQEPAPSTWKERRAERNKEKAAKKACPVGTAATYDMVEQLKEREKMTDNSMRPYRERAEAQGIDRRCLRSFCQGYRKNRFGSPASEEDVRRKQEDERFLEDYCSGDRVRRRRHLDRIVNEITEIRFSPDMFTPHSLRHNLKELKFIGERMNYIQNLKNENPEYFERLRLSSPGRWERFEAAEEMGVAFVALLTTYCQTYGVEVNSGKYFRYDQMEAIREGQTNLDAWKENFRTAIQEYQRKCVYATYRYHAEWSAQSIPSEELRPIAMGCAEHERQTNRTFEQLKEDPRLGLSTEELTSDAVARAKTLLIPGEAHAEENIRTIRLMRELERHGYKRPSADLYVRTRTFVAPLVQRILDYHVTDLLGLQPGLLLDHVGELEDLARKSEIAEPLLKLQHPFQDARQGALLMMEDEVLGSRGNEFIYKCAEIRALAKEGRMIALLASGFRENKRVGEEYLTEEERREAGGFPEILIGRKLHEAEEEIKSAKKRYQDVRTPGTEEFESWAKDINLKGKLEREPVDMKYEPVTSEFKKKENSEIPQDPEILQAIERLMEEPYYSLEYTKEQLKDLGMPENLGESLFRSFGAFLKKEAAKTLLSPEDFRQMLLDLGAGTGMHCEPWESVEKERTVDEDGEELYVRRTVQHPATPREELEPAIQKNRAGLATYKRIMEAQYDMISRKYGRSLAFLDITDLVDHYSDIFRDFGEVQVEDRMVSRFPGFLDLGDEQDRLLYHRVKYYGMVGKKIYDLYVQLWSETATENVRAIRSKSDIWQAVTDLLKNDQGAMEAEQYLNRYDPAFKHADPDWGQKVHAPEQE